VAGRKKNWRKLHSDELHQTTLGVPNQTVGNGVRYRVYMGEKRNEYKVLVGKTEEIRRLERPRQGWKDNIKMNFKPIGLEVLYWIHVARDK
jgi:hypothetical protein